MHMFNVVKMVKMEMKRDVSYHGKAYDLEDDEDNEDGEDAVDEDEESDNLYQGEAYCGAHTDQASCPEVINCHSLMTRYHQGSVDFDSRP